MSDADMFAMYELVCDMHWTDAAKFIQCETGESFRHTPIHLDHIARIYPESKCARGLSCRNGRA